MSRKKRDRQRREKKLAALQAKKIGRTVYWRGQDGMVQGTIDRIHGRVLWVNTGTGELFPINEFQVCYDKPHPYVMADVLNEPNRSDQ